MIAILLGLWRGLRRLFMTRDLGNISTTYSMYITPRAGYLLPPDQTRDPCILPQDLAESGSLRAESWALSKTSIIAKLAIAALGEAVVNKLVSLASSDVLASRNTGGFLWNPAQTRNSPRIIHSAHKPIPVSLEPRQHLPSVEPSIFLHQLRSGHWCALVETRFTRTKRALLSLVVRQALLGLRHEA